MISRALARRLSEHLNWTPANGDLFFIPRDEISDSVFLVSDMVVELVTQHRESRFHFNGTTEWALDSVATGDVVWLPREDQLRDLIGEHFLSLDRTGEGYVVSLSGPTRADHTDGQSDAADAYAVALLAILAAEREQVQR